jgi:hypothetical protein
MMNTIEVNKNIFEASKPVREETAAWNSGDKNWPNRTIEKRLVLTDILLFRRILYNPPTLSGAYYPPMPSE